MLTGIRSLKQACRMAKAESGDLAVAPYERPDEAEAASATAAAVMMVSVTQTSRTSSNSSGSSPRSHCCQSVACS